MRTIYQIIMLVELMLYYTAMAVISVRLFGAACHHKRLILSYAILFVPLLAIELTGDTPAANWVSILFFIPEIILLKLSLSPIRIRTLLAEYFSLYTANIIITAALLAALPVGTPWSWLVELAVHILMLSVCLLFSYSSLQFKVKLLFNWTPKGTKRILLVMLGCNAFLSTVLLHAPLVADPIIGNVTKAAFVLLMLMDGLIVSGLLVYTMMNKHIRHTIEHYEEQLRAQSDYYQKLSASNFELRRFRHDCRNICIGLEKLLAEGRTHEALEMLHSSCHEATQASTGYDTGNGIVDALLEDKSQQAKALNTRIVFDGHVAPTGIQPTDLCVIFGNTLDNALDACSKMPPDEEKVISIRCDCNSGFLFLDMTNPIDKPLILNGSLPTTTKTDKAEHGFGLYSLNKTVQKYDGTLHCTATPHHFTVSIHLCAAPALSTPLPLHETR